MAIERHGVVLVSAKRGSKMDAFTGSMQRADRLEEYRQMTPAERLRLTFELIEGGWHYLNVGTERQVRRKYQQIRDENDLANRRILEVLERSKKAAD